jgi:hypothetical protein
MKHEGLGREILAQFARDTVIKHLTGWRKDEQETK